jgi:7-cyano-7-deazaguanine reductase
MYSNVDPELKTKIKTLSMEYTDRPQPELLIRVPNPHPSLNYVVESISSEFTSLCPLAQTQPDFATITIRYIPDKWCIELKSEKFYLVSYRTVSIFHEAVVGQIYKDLYKFIHPRQLCIEGNFTTRGGIKTSIKVGSVAL